MSASKIVGVYGCLFFLFFSFLTLGSFDLYAGIFGSGFFVWLLFARCFFVSYFFLCGGAFCSLLVFLLAPAGFSFVII